MPPLVRSSEMPRAVNPSMTLFSTTTDDAGKPGLDDPDAIRPVPAPLMSSQFSRTVRSVSAGSVMLMMTPVAGGRHQDRPVTRAGRAVDGDRLGDRHGAEAARIEHADFAVLGGLRDRARERLAGRGAAARVDVVADAGNPGPRRLRVRLARRKHEGECTRPAANLFMSVLLRRCVENRDTGCMLAIAAPGSL